MSVSTSEILVHYTNAEFKGHPMLTSHFGTTTWSIAVVGKMTVFELSIGQ